MLLAAAALDDDCRLASPGPARTEQRRELGEGPARGLFVELRHFAGDTGASVTQDAGGVLERFRQPVRRFEPDQSLGAVAAGFEKTAALPGAPGASAHP